MPADQSKTHATVALRSQILAQIQKNLITPRYEHMIPKWNAQGEIPLLPAEQAESYKLYDGEILSDCGRLLIVGVAAPSTQKPLSHNSK